MSNNNYLLLFTPPDEIYINCNVTRLSVWDMRKAGTDITFLLFIFYFSTLLVTIGVVDHLVSSSFLTFFPLVCLFLIRKQCVCVNMRWIVFLNFFYFHCLWQVHCLFFKSFSSCWTNLLLLPDWVISSYIVIWTSF